MGVLRSLLAIAVLIGHSDAFFGITLVNGRIAVQSFYIISGFYMALVLSEKYKDAYKSFYQYYLFISNRVLRLFPVYWTVLLSVILFSLLSMILGLKGWNLSFIIDSFNYLDIEELFFIIFSNLFILGQDLMFFLGLDKNSGNFYLTSTGLKESANVHQYILVGQAWTLSIELMFYLIAPWLTKIKTNMLVILLGIGLIIKFILHSNGYTYFPWGSAFFPAELTFFIGGILAFRVYTNLKMNKLSLLIIAYSFLIIIIFASFVFNSFPLSFDIKGWIYVSLVLFSIPFLFGVFKDSSLDTKIGEYSFPIYIVHIFIIKIVDTFMMKFTPSYSNYAGEIVILISLVSSFLLINYLILPIEKMRKKRVVSKKELIAT